MDRVLIVPAAGRGSRLGMPGPKALAPVAGRPMLDHLLALHGTTIALAVVVVAPQALAQFKAYSAASDVAIELAVQDEPTGMLDAILAAGPAIARLRPWRVAVTWCDQIALTTATVERVATRGLAAPAAALVFPTAMVDRPYIHFDRDGTGCIVAVRQRREGDDMPVRGETDVGLFDLSLETYLGELPAFAERTRAGAGTGERNFLPFIPWLAASRPVETIAGVEAIETVGINTPEELSAIEAHLRHSRL